MLDSCERDTINAATANVIEPNVSKDLMCCPVSPDKSGDDSLKTAYAKDTRFGSCRLHYCDDNNLYLTQFSLSSSVKTLLIELGKNSFCLYFYLHKFCVNTLRKRSAYVRSYDLLCRKVTTAPAIVRTYGNRARLCLLN